MRLPIELSETSAEPLYHQIEVQLRSMIVSGTLPEGTLLPSIREFASQLKCSVITVRRVYQDLENEGLLRTRQGTGTFVAYTGDEAKAAFKTEAVRRELWQAANAGRSVGLTEEELRQIFQQVLTELYDGKRKADRP